MDALILKGAMAARHLTAGECALVRAMFSDAIDPARVELRRWRWFPFQPREIAMAPCGHIHFHPDASIWREDFAAADIWLQALFVHEMTHVWQTQRGGRFYLPLIRHPFSRYRYVLKPGKPFRRYGVEQQAEIVRHAFLLRRGVRLANRPPLTAYEAVLPFATGPA